MADVKLRKAYKRHKLSNPKGLFNASALQVDFSRLHDEIEKRVPESRERAVAITHLENAFLWAIRAIEQNDPESEVM